MDPIRGPRRAERFHLPSLAMWNNLLITGSLRDVFSTASNYLDFLVSLVCKCVHVCISLKRIYEVASDGVFRDFVNGIKHASA